MKKIFRILLTSVLLCTMFTVLAVPALAAPKQNVGIVDITSDTDFSNKLESLDDNQKIVFNLKKDICVDHEITINANNCSILIRVDSDYYSKYGDAKIYPAYLTDDHFRFLNIEGDNVKLYFDGHVICRDFRIDSGRGGAINVDGKNCLIASGRFYNCVAYGCGGAICFHDVNPNVKQCHFKQCRSINEGGGAIMIQQKGGRVEECVFEDNSCANRTVQAVKYIGDDVQCFRRVPDTVVQNCTSNSKREDNYYQCVVNPENIPVSGGVNLDDIFGTDLDNRYTRPDFSKYAQDTMAADGFCDAARPDKADSVLSEKGYFTLNGSNFYGGTWSVSSESPLTVTAKEGYLIERVEAVVDYSEGKFENLLSDKGTLSKEEKNSNAWNKDIVSVNDIYSPTVTITTNGNKYNNKTIHFSEVIAYFVEDTPENRRTEAPEASPEYTRDGETYDVFNFNKDIYTAGSDNTKSELKGFTLKDTAVSARARINGWATAVTITAPEGYTITRIEGKPVHFESNVEFLESDAGTIVNKGKRLASDGIVRVNDINASSVTLSCTSDYVEFGEFLVFYTPTPSEVAPVVETTAEDVQSEVQEPEDTVVEEAVNESYDDFVFDISTASNDSSNTVKSESKGFVLTDSVPEGREQISGWATTVNITVPVGYTITRIEGNPVNPESNVGSLVSSAGTIENSDGIVHINGINAGSLDLSCTSDYVEFSKFRVYYTTNASVGSVFSGGAIGIIIGVVVAAVVAAVVIVVVRKKKNPVPANNATVEDSEEEDE